jgi:hypothetical protein
VYIEHSIDDAAHVASHPQGAELDRMSKSHVDSGIWQLRQAILYFSPIAPSCPS